LDGAAPKKWNSKVWFEGVKQNPTPSGLALTRGEKEKRQLDDAEKPPDKATSLSGLAGSRW
jgi:hypothetical protein